VFRGRTLEWLDAKLVLDEVVVAGQPTLAEGRIAQHLGWRHSSRAADTLIRKTIAWTWKVKLSLSLERDLFSRLRETAEAVAIKVFADNLRDLLLAAPAGKRVVMGLDPGIRTGVKVAVVSDTGRVLATDTVFPHEPRRDWEGSLHTLARLVATHGVNLIAIGNGTASRETDQLAADLIKRIQKIAPEAALDKAVVSEAGASVYSASEFASTELRTSELSIVVDAIQPDIRYDTAAVIVATVRFVVMMVVGLETESNSTLSTVVTVTSSEVLKTNLYKPSP
jgi:uncharacterized protein